MKLLALVAVLALAGAAAAKCPAQNNDLHATFTELGGHITCQVVKGTCMPGYTQAAGGPPEACCSETGSWNKPKNPCVKAAPTTTKPAPTTTKPAPTTTKPAPTTTKPAPTTTKPAPTTTKPAPTTTKPAPTTTKPAPTTTKPAPTTTKPAPTTTKPAPTTTKPAPTATPKPGPAPTMAYAVTAFVAYDDVPDSICAALSFDRMTFSNGTHSVTIDSAEQLEDDTPGACPSFSVAAPFSATPVIEPNFSGKVGKIDVDIETSIKFTVNGTYTKADVSAFDTKSGNGAVSVASVLITVYKKGDQTTPLMSATFTKFGQYLTATHDKSLKCALATNFTMPNTKTANYTLTLENFSMEAVTPQNIHGKAAPIGGTAVCPASSPSSSASKTGLVIGGIIGGLAVIGILMFVYTRCKSERDGYQSLDPV